MNAPATHLWLEQPRRVGDQLILSCTIERPDSSTASLWYRIPQAYESALNPRADAFVLGALFTAMRIGHPMYAHGEVSSSLLRNLEEFQAAWARWAPSRYHPVEITPDRESTDLLPSTRGQAVFGYSGGVDSTFTLYRHTRRLAGRRSRRLGVGLLIHGFDIPLAQTSAFETVTTRAARLLRDEAVDLVPLVTNFRELGDDWEDVFAAALASCLHLFAGGYGAGLIGSSEPYDHLVIPWGSTPITDHLLSADDFPIINDGAEYARIDKVAEIGGWEEARRTLRVCWAGPRSDANCGVCEKCIRTILCFRALDLGLPDCFERDVEDEQIRALRGMSRAAVAEMELVAAAARARGTAASWLQAVEAIIEDHRVKHN